MFLQNDIQTELAKEQQLSKESLQRIFPAVKVDNKLVSYN